MGALAPIIEGCGHDIRQVLNQVQFFGTVSSSTGKDTQVMVSPFDAGLKLLCKNELKPLPMATKMDLFYIDSDLMPMMIQENYLRTYEKSNRNIDDPVELDKAAKAAECIALADAMSGNWELQGSAAVIGSIFPAFLTADASFTRATFPAVLQKIAPMNKAKRKRVQDNAAIAGDAVDEEDDGGAGVGDGDEDGGGLIKKRKASAKKAAAKAGASKVMSKEAQIAKCTLNGWIPKDEAAELNRETEKKAGMLFKYIDGHT